MRILLFVIGCLLTAGCGGSGGSNPSNGLTLDLDLGLPTINLSNASNYNISGICQGSESVSVEISSPQLIDSADCVDGRFSIQMDLSTLISENPVMQLIQNGNVKVVNSLVIPRNDQTPIAESPAIDDVGSPLMAEQIQINFNCEEVGQQIIFAGSGIQNSPIPFQCNTLGLQNLNLNFVTNFESNANIITVSGFDNSGNPNSANTSFNLPIDTKSPVLSVQSTGSLNQGENTEFQVLFADLNLPASFNYNVTLAGAISDTVSCLSNPCVIQHSSVQGAGNLTLTISANAVTDTVGNVSSTASVNFNYEILPAPDITHTFNVQGVSSLDLGIKTSNGKSWKVNWGDLGPIQTFSSSETQRHEHTYLTAFSGEITVSVAWDSEIVGFYANNSNLNTNANSLPSTLTDLILEGDNALSGNVSGLPRSLEKIIIQGSNTLSGALNGLPSNSKVVEIFGQNTLTGNVSSLPISLETLVLSGNSNLSGNLNAIPASLKVLRILGQNNITGSIASLPTSLNSIEILGENTVSGFISQIPATITEFIVKGTNTIAGSINDLNANVSIFSLSGDGSLNGSVANLPAQLRVLEIDRSNDITGAISDLPSNLEVIYFQSTAITGNISGFPQSLQSINLSGTTSINGNFLSLPANVEKFRLNLTNASGSINFLPSGLREFEVIGYGQTDVTVSLLPAGLRSLVLYDGSLVGTLADLPQELERLSLLNTISISGNVVDLPRTLKILSITGINNTVTGAIADLPPDLESLQLAGTNTVAGDFIELPKNINYLGLSGGTVLTANSITWNRTNLKYRYLLIHPNVGLNTQAVDNILVMLSEITTWEGNKSVSLQGNNQGPSSVGLNARTVILNNGATTVNHN